MFKEIKEENFVSREERILNFWKEKNIFQKSLSIREKNRSFSFYDGPPFATGLPHYGHLLVGTIKDVIPRYKTMKGFYVPRRFGWDCHGLPVENEIEKQFDLSGAPSISKFGIHRFNEECRKIVFKYAAEWETTVERFGRWVDFSKTWHTMDVTFMESVWWVFKQVYEKGLIYEGFKVMPFSAKLGTPLSNFEATENYKEVDDPSIVVTLPLKEEPNTMLLVWTTTPWTLISNMAATVGEDIEYVKVAHENKFYILAATTYQKWIKDGEIISSFPGSKLVGKHYTPVFPYFQNTDCAFKIISGDFVTTEEGTGIVHTAPAFGESDFYACQKANIPLVCPVDNNGCFTHQVPEYEGKFVKDVDKELIRRLQKEERLFYRGTIRHRYPFCWRSDTPLIYKAITTWFLDVEKIKDKIIKANKRVHWTPEHVKEGRFGKWLEQARDWAISRNRYWGTPIPIWRSDDGEIHVIGSIAELEALTNTKVKDLHRHFIDHLTFKKDGKTFKRVTEVLDCWFDAGSMPYAQNHYPFENKQVTEKNFPADFIAESIDQTRGWFYTLIVLSAALFDMPAYKNVITNGIILAEDGNKMSKRLKNYPEPTLLVNECGADAIRLYMLNSPVVKADDLNFSKAGVEEVLKQVLIPLWNIHRFLNTYVCIYKWTPPQHRDEPAALLDKWIIAKLHRLIHEVENGMDDYDLSKAVEPFVGFIDQLTNWYIRRSRRRFWADEESLDRNQAFSTLYYVLMELCKIAAPFIPFVSEAIYQDIKLENMPESIHLCDYPIYNQEYRDLKLEEYMDDVQLVVSLGHSLRKEQKIKVRQPLPAIHVICGNNDLTLFLKNQAHLILEELNVKEIFFHKENQEFVKLSIKPNFRILGKKVGKHMKEAQILIDNLDQASISEIFRKKTLQVNLGGENFTLTDEDVSITCKVHEGVVAINAGPITVALETQLSEELIMEGIAREIVNKVNTMRRQANFAVTDRISIHLWASEKIQKAFDIHKEAICKEILATKVLYEHSEQSTNWDINGEPAAIYITKV